MRWHEGCEGVAAINTIQSVMGVNLDTLRPEPSVEGWSTPGGYSSKAVKPIALAKVSCALPEIGICFVSSSTPRTLASLSARKVIAFTMCSTNRIKFLFKTHTCGLTAASIRCSAMGSYLRR